MAKYLSFNLPIIATFQLEIGSFNTNSVSHVATWHISHIAKELSRCALYVKQNKRTQRFRTASQFGSPIAAILTAGSHGRQKWTSDSNSTSQNSKYTTLNNKERKPFILDIF